MTPLWLTRIIPDPRNRDARRDTGDAVALHHRVMQLFPDDLDTNARHEAGVLFRVDDTPRGSVILVQSVLEPDLSRLPDGYGSAARRHLTPLLEKLRAGNSVHYRITANATRKLGTHTTAGRPRQILPLHGEEAVAWWHERAASAGLTLHTVHGFELDDAAGRRRPTKTLIRHARTRFDGIATVTDPALLTERMATGFGRGKSYGCGLLTLAPAA
ncbi:type I-E CRISPR-associated protein Cas6/Cse3/CasE [Embleya sp. MST-111070]|uniref:type I-E CRISPR-associated protein Cas6/Cse3/CasE n=1 Tax=Embleya sp. MST-111070 TaxID=3398231 RepID=UPI003F73FC83